MKTFCAGAKGAGLAVLCSILSAGASVSVQRHPQDIQISIDGQPFTTYYLDPAVAKPYLMPLRSASGIVVTRGFPVKNDVSKGNPKASSFEPHQRPLYFAHGNLDGLDFWAEPLFDKYYSDHAHQAYGHMVLKSVDEAKSDGDKATLRAQFTLNDPNNRVIGEETQSFIFHGDEKTRYIDCEFVLRAKEGPLDIGDTKEGTFAIRLAPELSAPNDHMLNSNGATGEKAIWGKRADWVDYSGTMAGKRVDVAIFDSPESFRHPTTWHARAYGLFAANPFGLREFTKDPKQDGSWTIPERNTATFRYRVMIHEGEFQAAEIAAAYAHYASEK
jgi:hypothetical protein